MLLAFCPLLWNFTICIQLLVWTSSCGSHWANLYLSYLICNMKLHQLSICPVKMHSNILILINESYCICAHIGMPHLLGLCLILMHVFIKYNWYCVTLIYFNLNYVLFLLDVTEWQVKWKFFENLKYKYIDPVALTLLYCDVFLSIICQHLHIYIHIQMRFHFHQSLVHIGLGYKARHKNKSDWRQSIVTQYTSFTWAQL